MILVETTGCFQLQEFNTRNHIRESGYTVVPRTEQAGVWVAEQKLCIVANLGDGATDKEWLEYVAASDGDLTLARASFISAFPPAGFEASEAPKKRK